MKTRKMTKKLRAHLHRAIFEHNKESERIINNVLAETAQSKREDHPPMKSWKEPNMKTRKGEKVPVQTNWQATYDAGKHTEDCMDANDDTSIEKGCCICPKPQHTPTPLEVELLSALKTEHSSCVDLDELNSHSDLVCGICQLIVKAEGK